MLFCGALSIYFYIWLQIRSHTGPWNTSANLRLSLLPPLFPVGKGGISALRFWRRPNINTCHLDRRSKYISHIYSKPSQGRRTLQAMQGHTSVAPDNKVNNQGLWEAGSVVSKGWGALGSCWRLWLACLYNSTGWQATKTCNSGIRGTVPGFQIRRVVWSTPCFRCQGSTSYWVLILGLRLQARKDKPSTGQIYPESFWAQCLI